jgi:hypothetical protein
MKDETLNMGAEGLSKVDTASYALDGALELIDNALIKLDMTGHILIERIGRVSRASYDEDVRRGDEDPMPPRSYLIESLSSIEGRISRVTHRLNDAIERLDV